MKRTHGVAVRPFFAPQTAAAIPSLIRRRQNFPDDEDRLDDLLRVSLPILHLHQPEKGPSVPGEELRPLRGQAAQLSPDLLSLVVGDLLDADGHRFDGRVVDASKIALHRSLPVPADLLFGRMHRRRF